MNKYIYSSKMAIIDLAAYPARFFSNIWIDGISLLVFFFLWSNLYQNKEVVNGYTLKGMITYYAVTFTIRKLTNSKTISRRISYNIRYGTMSNFLLQPLNFMWHFFFRLVTQISFQTIVPIIFVLALTYGTNVLEKPQNIPFIFIALFLSSVITYLFYAITGCMAFWTVQSWGINSMIGRFAAILSGAVIPLSFFPQYIQNINNYLPFKYMGYTPVSIYVGVLEGRSMFFNLGIQLVWIGILTLVLTIVWDKALIKYDAVGN